MFFEEIENGTRKLIKETVNPKNDYAIISASDVTRLAHLLMNIQSRSSLPMQIHINNYLADVTSAGISFLVFPQTLTSDFVVTCVADVAIDPPLYIKDGSWAALKVVLEPAEPQPVAFKANCMDNRVQDIVSKKNFERIGEPFTHFLMVPSYLPSSEKPQLVVVLISTVKNDEDLDRDLTLVGECIRYVAPTLRNTMVAEEMKEHHRKLKLIITQVDEVAKHVANDGLLIAGIKNTMKKVLHSESSAIFLKEDKYLVSNSHEYGRPLDMENELKLPNLKIPLGVGITGVVGTTGGVMMTNEAQKEEIYCNVPSNSSYYRKALGFPFIFKEKIFAVGEVYNKPEDYIGSDKIYAHVIGKLFGPILKQSLDLRKANDMRLKKDEVTKQLGLQTELNPEDEKEMLRIRDMYLSKPFPAEEFGKLDFLPSTVPAEDSITYILGALADLLLIETLDLKIDCLISDIEAFAMLMAALCNGCGYQGTTHRFQLTSGIVLASVYTSPGRRNELYAIQLSFLAFNNPLMNFFMGTTKETYQNFLRLLDFMILSTDLADFVENVLSVEFSSRPNEQLSKKVEHPQTVLEEKSEEEHNRFCRLLMACSKMSDHARIWEHALEIGDRLFKEFHRSNQSTCATRVFNIPGIDSLPMRAKLQNHFITSICIPAFKILQKEIPGFFDGCASNMEINLRKLDALFKVLKKQELTERGDVADDAGEYVAPNDDD